MEVVCSFPSCAAVHNNNWLSTVDKKYYFCSKIHKYNMTKTLNLCKVCDKYLNHRENVCNNCFNKCKSCITCDKDLIELSEKQFEKETHICEKCVSDGYSEFITCSSRCYYQHNHTTQQSGILAGGSNPKYGCGHDFPLSGFYNCDVCFEAKYCSYNCLREHFIDKEKQSSLHRDKICRSVECKVLLKFLPPSYKCKSDCCSFCTKSCALKYAEKDKSCPMCGCRNCGNLCDKCRTEYCIECKEVKAVKCTFKGQSCDSYLCNKEMCLKKHHNTFHKLYVAELCENKGCYNAPLSIFSCRCGLKYCSVICNVKDKNMPCNKCFCSHSIRVCHAEECHNTICGTCMRFCDSCTYKLENIE